MTQLFQVYLNLYESVIYNGQKPTLFVTPLYVAVNVLMRDCYSAILKFRGIIHENKIDSLNTAP